MYLSFSLMMLLLSVGADQPETNGKAVLEQAPWTVVEAEDPNACRIEGQSSVQVYPRTVGRRAVILLPGSRLTASTEARAVYLRLPVVFASPGPRYMNLAGSRLRVRVDERPWQEIALAVARQELPVAEDLPPGKHVITVEPVDGFAAVDGFRFAPAPLSSLQGTIVTADYSELLTDVRADIFTGDRLVRTEYVRSPITGQFEVWGLAPGHYRILLTAAGWTPHDIAEVAIQRPGQTVDLGIVAFARDARWGGSDIQRRVGPRFGRSVSVAPGGSFRAMVNFQGAPPQSARLVSQWKTIDLRVSDVEKYELGIWNDVGVATFHVPPSTPHDMYRLALSFSGSEEDAARVLGQAVCVREPLPQEFFVAGIGHMNTWGQQTAEYLARVAEMAELAGARTLLISNEVNAAYVSGALANLRIPYLVTQGNHTMPRWDEFFGWSSLVHDDGAMRVVTFGRWPYESWHEARRLIGARPDAANRILLCYEGYAPIDLIRGGQVDLLFDGHSDAKHPDRGEFPSGTFHTRAPNQESIRWIAMTPQGVSPQVAGVDDMPVLKIPRSGLSPLRVDWSGPNDGTADRQMAVITNEYPIRFSGVRLRFLLRRGSYRLVEAKAVQIFDSDDGQSTVIDAETSVDAGKTVAVQVLRQE